MNFFISVTAALTFFSLISSTHAGLIVTDPKAHELANSKKKAREAIESDPDVLTEADAPTPRPVPVRRVAPSPVVVRKRVLVEAPEKTRSDAARPKYTGPSLNELQLQRMREQTRLIAEAPKPVAKPAPKATPKSAAKPAAAKPIPMQTEVVGDPVTETSETPAEASESSRSESDAPHAAFAYTHGLPSPMNIPGGTYVIGTNVAVGVTDFLQLSTNVLRDVTRYWNIQAKVPLIEFPTFIASAFVNWDTFNLNNFDETNPDQRITAWQPGIVTGYEMTDDMAFFIGGNFNATSTDIIRENIRTSGFAHGARVNFDWSWLYNPPSSRLADNALSAGVNYDLTYKHLGFGITHHWPTFQFGLHYVLNADRYRVMPILNVSSGFTF